MGERGATVRGREVRFRVEGEGDPLVLVHGLSGSSRWWSPLLPALCESRAVHLVDLPRFGRGFGPHEAADWLGELVEAAALGPIDLVGHSFGGLLAAQLAARRPDAVRRLVLVAPTGVPAGRSLLGYALPLAAALYETRERVITVAADALWNGPPSLLLGALHAAGADLRAELGTIRTPTLLVWGERDHLVPVRLAEDWRRQLPDARLVVIPKAAHVPMWDAPAELAAAVLAFLQEGPDEGGDSRGG